MISWGERLLMGLLGMLCIVLPVGAAFYLWADSPLVRTVVTVVLSAALPSALWIAFFFGVCCLIVAVRKGR